VFYLDANILGRSEKEEEAGEGKKTPNQQHTNQKNICSKAGLQQKRNSSTYTQLVCQSCDHSN